MCWLAFQLPLAVGREVGEIGIGLRFSRVGLRPELSRNGKRFDIERLPPANFVACLVEPPVMPSTKWHCEFITDFHA